MSKETNGANDDDVDNNDDGDDENDDDTDKDSGADAEADTDDDDDERDVAGGCVDGGAAPNAGGDDAAAAANCGDGGDGDGDGDSDEDACGGGDNGAKDTDTNGDNDKASWMLAILRSTWLAQNWSKPMGDPRSSKPSPSRKVAPLKQCLRLCGQWPKTSHLVLLTLQSDLRDFFLHDGPRSCQLIRGADDKDGCDGVGGDGDAAACADRADTSAAAGGSVAEAGEDKVDDEGADGDEAACREGGIATENDDEDDDDNDEGEGDTDEKDEDGEDNDEPWVPRRC